MKTWHSVHASRHASWHTSLRASEPLLALAVTAVIQLVVVGSASLPLALLASAVMLTATLGIRAFLGGVSLVRLDTGTLAILVVHALIFPLVFVVLGFTRLPLSEDDVRRALSAHLALIGAAWSALAFADLVLERPAPIAVLPGALAHWARARSVHGGTGLLIVAFMTATGALLYAISTGQFFAFAGADRRLVYLSTGEERLWYARYAIQGFLLWGLAFAFGRTDRPWLRWSAVLSALLFLVATLGTGGRRDVVGVLLPLALLVYTSVRTARAKRAVLIGVGAALVGLLGFAVVRTWSGERSIADLVTLYEILGEFLFPWQVTGYLVANPPPPLMGETYLYPLVLWIPRSAWLGKPVILAEQFSDLAGVADQLGFGFSPVAEAIWNFGVDTGPWIAGILVALLLRGTMAVIAAQPLLFLAVVGRILSVPRSELASVIGELLILSAVFVLCDLVADSVGRFFPAAAAPMPRPSP